MLWFIKQVLEENGRLYNNFADFCETGMELREILSELTDYISNSDLASRIGTTIYVYDIGDYGKTWEQFSRDDINEWENAIWEILTVEGFIEA